MRSSNPWSLLAAVWLALSWASAGAQSLDLPEILQRGSIRIAFYNGLPPFSDKGRGIDVDVASAVARKLGVQLAPVWFDADENMADDLRNMVWKGHYLGVGPADAMMHVPVDPGYISANERVLALAPYFRDGFAIAYDTRRIKRLETLEVFARETVAVEGDTWPDSIMLAADGRRYRDNVVHFRSGTQAVEALKTGRVGAVFARRSELQAGLSGGTHFAVAAAPLPSGSTREWTIGMAIKFGHDALARALEQAMSDLQSDGTLARIFAEHGVEQLDLGEKSQSPQDQKKNGL